MTALYDLVVAIKGAPLDIFEQDAINQAWVNSGFDPMPASWVNPKLYAVAARHLEDEEGRTAHADRVHLGYLTTGIGRLIAPRRGGALLNSEIDLLLANDIAARVNAMVSWPAWRRVESDPVRATALLSMCFQVGMTELRRFTTTLALVAAGQFDDAADAVLASRLAEQNPAHGAWVSAMMRTGDLR